MIKLYDVQKALYDYLKAYYTTYDYVPKDPSYPCVRVCDDPAKPYDTKTHEGLEISLTIHAWSKSKGKKEIKMLLDDIRAKMKSLSMSNLQAVYFQHMEVFDETEDIKHGALEYQIKLMEV
jgi:hypothetical protein